MENYRSFSDNVSILYKIGFDLHEGEYPTVEQVEKILDTVIESHYGKEGVDWVTWFIFESNWGEKDWSTCDACNENGELICYSFESLYEYLEKLKNGIHK